MTTSGFWKDLRRYPYFWVKDQREKRGVSTLDNESFRKREIVYRIDR